LLSHKEFRFIQPLLPLLHVLAARSLTSWPVTASITSSQKAAHWFAVRPTYLVLIAIWTYLPSFYFLSYHCRAQVGIMDVLRMIPCTELRTVGFLMPCHSTPWQSRLHRIDLEDSVYGGSGEAGRIWFLTCEPPIKSQNPTTYRDQSDFFYASPIRYLNDRLPRQVDPNFPPSPLTNRTSARSSDQDDLGWRHEWPSHIVLFEALLRQDEISSLLKERGYIERIRLWNSHWHEDPRRAGDIVLLEWSPKLD